MIALSETIPATGLRWPGATAQQLEFMKRVYDLHVSRSSSRRTYIADIPAGELRTIEGSYSARINAANDCIALLKEVRSLISSLNLNINVGIGSAYRSASSQFLIWERNFPNYYNETQTDRRSKQGGEHGNEAARFLASYIGARVGAPGFSNHNNGLAIDFSLVENSVPIPNRTQLVHTQRWRNTWFFNWMQNNASRYNYFQNNSINEPWHWEYRASALPAITEDYLYREDDAALIKSIASHLLQSNILNLSAKVRLQLTEISQAGMVSIASGPVTPSLVLLNMLKVLNDQCPLPPASSTSVAPFSIMSLVRPNASYHTKGAAVDISRYAGHSIVMTNPEGALNGVLAIINNLPDGCYSLGLPRPIRNDPEGATIDFNNPNYSALRYIYNPGNSPQLKPEFADLPSRNTFLQVNSPADIHRSPKGSTAKDLDFIPDIASRTRLKSAIQAAKSRGANILYIFPDALDHIHIQVIPCPHNHLIKGTNAGSSELITYTSNPIRQFTPSTAATNFRCAPTPVAINSATLLPESTATPDNALSAALQQLGLSATQIATFERNEGFRYMRPVASVFGEDTLVELIRRTRYSPSQIVNPPHTYGNNLQPRLGLRHKAPLLSARTLLCIPGHFRELARRSPNSTEAHALENYGWLLMNSLRNRIHTQTGVKWWLPPSPEFVTYFSSTLPSLSPQVQMMIISSMLIDSTINFSDYLGRKNIWENNLPCQQWKLETGLQNSSQGPGLPFYSQIIAIPQNVNTTQPQQRIRQVWQQRLANTDQQHPPLSQASTHALTRCNNNMIDNLGLMQFADFRGLQMSYDYPVKYRSNDAAPNGIVSRLKVLTAIEPVIGQLFQTIHTLGWNDLLYQTSGAGCFRGIKVPGAGAAAAARRISNHSFGLALDFNVHENGQNINGSMDPRIVALFEAFRFRWGKCFPTPDPMHFEYCGGAC